MKIGDRPAYCRVLLQARQQAGLTQRQLAKKLKWSRHRIWNLENGKAMLDVVELIEYAHSLAADPAELLEKIGELRSKGRGRKRPRGRSRKQRRPG